MYMKDRYLIEYMKDRKYHYILEIKLYMHVTGIHAQENVHTHAILHLTKNYNDNAENNVNFLQIKIELRVSVVYSCIIII